MRDDVTTGAPAPSPGEQQFADWIRDLEAMEGDWRGDGATPEDVLTAFPELADVEVADVPVDGPAGPVPARLYRPGGASAAPIRAGLVWVHGGAFVMGTLDMAESHATGLRLAHRGVAVLALDYRKALRGVRYPAPLDDVDAGWRWAVDHADELGVAPGDLHLGGGSAGGALVAGLALRLRDTGGPVPRSLVLAYTAVHGGPVVDEDELARIRTLAPDALFDPGFMRAATRQYAGDAVGAPYAFAANGDAGGLPPQLVLTCEVDTLRFSAEAWARDVEAAGGVVVLEDLPGAPHGVLDQPTTPHGRVMLDRIARWLLDGR